MNNEYIDRTAKAWNVPQSRAQEMLLTQYATTLRINPLRVRKSTLANIKATFKSVQKIDWVDNAYTVSGGVKNPSELTEFANGEIIIQNPSSFIPVLELQTNPSERILDMCAAPGAKSSHIAAITNNKAQLLLNDTSRTRFFKMKKLMKTMGVHAEFSLRDGRNLAKDYGGQHFDKILLDAPCSGEANLTLQDMESFNYATTKRLHTLQVKLLQNAFALLKVGGRLVYSTCTIAPEENELVVDSLLKHNIQAEIITPGEYPVSQMPGRTEWNGKQLDARLCRTIRLLPSSACKPFYIATITKQNTEEDDSYERLSRRYS